MITGPTTTGVILAGGRSSRMGQDKALLPIGGLRLIELVFQRLQQVCPEIVIVAKQPALYDFLPGTGIPDTLDGTGPLVGIHAALEHCTTAGVFVVGCDMPLLQEDLIRYQISLADRWDVVVPYPEQRPEPLHAWYSGDCLSAIVDQLADGQVRITSFFEQVRTKKLSAADMRVHDPGLISCTNVNTPEQFDALAKTDINGDIS